MVIGGLSSSTEYWAMGWRDLYCAHTQCEGSTRENSIVVSIKFGNVFRKEHPSLPTGVQRFPKRKRGRCSGQCDYNYHLANHTLPINLHLQTSPQRHGREPLKTDHQLPATPVIYISSLTYSQIVSKLGASVQLLEPAQHKHHTLRKLPSKQSKCLHMYAQQKCV